MIHYQREGIRIPSQVRLQLASHVPMFRATTLQGLVDSKENVKPHTGSSGYSLWHTAWFRWPVREYRRWGLNTGKFQPDEKSRGVTVVGAGVTDALAQARVKGSMRRRIH